MTDLRRDEAMEIEQAIVRQIQEDTATKLGVGIVINTGSIAARIRPALVRRDTELVALRNCAHGKHQGDQAAGGVFACTVCGFVLVSAEDTFLQQAAQPILDKILESIKVGRPPRLTANEITALEAALGGKI